MTRLIYLELKKYPIKNYLISTIIAGVIFLSLSIFVTETDEAIMYQTPTDILEFSALLVRIFFSILIGVMVAQRIIKEFETGTIRNLFLYPIPRKKIIISKLSFIVITSLGLMLLTHAWVAILGLLAQNIFHIVPGSISIMDFIAFFLRTMMLSIMTVFTSMGCLIVGLWKKTTTSTIITAVIISMVINGNLGTADSLSSNMFIMFVFTIVGIATVLYSMRKIETEDL